MRNIWWVRIADGKQEGWGECAPLEGLSKESSAQVENELKGLSRLLQGYEGALEALKAREKWADKLCASVRFATEMALLDLRFLGKRCLFHQNNFFSGDKPRIINGLIWMDEDIHTMKKQGIEKIQQGYRCLKIKVGKLPFEQECLLIRSLQAQSTRPLTIRVDANGALARSQAKKHLAQLAALHVHSIEQPLKAEDKEGLAELARADILPIALDESLIGICPNSEGDALLDAIKPNYIVLKPSLLGGFTPTLQWIRLAEKRKIGWWITSALESNIGLNALAQFSASLCMYHYQVFPEGLGTGQLYLNNLPSPMVIKGEKLYYNRQEEWKSPF